jgi:hypothetical protein
VYLEERVVNDKQIESLLGDSIGKKSSELTYLDRVAIFGFSTLGAVFIIILALAIYLNLS